VKIALGIDIGAISAKVAAVGGRDAAETLRSLGGSFRYLEAGPDGTAVLLSPYRRLKGSPLSAVAPLLDELMAGLPEGSVAGIGVTGSGGAILAEKLGVPQENEFRAIVRASVVLSPESRTILEMGGETSKYIRLDAGGLIADYETNGDCAAGTGSFIDQQATRLRYQVEEVGPVALGAGSAARIAGRCSVFAKTDMIHAQQKGSTPPEILRGLADAVARNFKASIVKGKPVARPAVFIGGLAANLAVVQALRDAFHLGEELSVPDGHAWFGAVGARLVRFKCISRSCWRRRPGMACLPCLLFPWRTSCSSGTIPPRIGLHRKRRRWTCASGSTLARSAPTSRWWIARGIWSRRFTSAPRAAP
jgi:hypothetical protein